MSIVQAIEAKRLSKLSAESVGSDRFLSSVKKQAEYAKLALNKDFDLSRQLEAQRIYYQYKNKYTGKHIPISPLESKKSISFWTGVVESADKASVSIEAFIAAQFAWFHKNFGTYPKFENLRTSCAIQRAQESQGIKPKKAVARYQAGDNFAETMRMADQQVRSMCQAQKLTRVQFYKELVLTGVVSLPEAFLKADKAYQEAKNNNE